MEAITEIVLIVFAILNLILFFKLWGATNNIRKIKQTKCDNLDLDTVKAEAKLAYLRGEDKDVVAKKLKECFLHELMVCYDNTYDYSFPKSDINNICDKYEKIFAELSITEHLPCFEYYKEDKSYLEL